MGDEIGWKVLRAKLIQIVLVQFIHGIRPLAVANHDMSSQCNYGVRNGIVFRQCETRHRTRIEMARERWHGVCFGEDIFRDLTLETI